MLKRTVINSFFTTLATLSFVNVIYSSEAGFTELTKIKESTAKVILELATKAYQPDLEDMKKQIELDIERTWSVFDQKFTMQPIFFNNYMREKMNIKATPQDIASLSEYKQDCPDDYKELSKRLGAIHYLDDQIELLKKNPDGSDEKKHLLLTRKRETEKELQTILRFFFEIQ